MPGSRSSIPSAPAGLEPIAAPACFVVKPPVEPRSDGFVEALATYLVLSQDESALIAIAGATLRTPSAVLRVVSQTGQGDRKKYSDQNKKGQIQDFESFVAYLHDRIDELKKSNRSKTELELVQDVLRGKSYLTFSVSSSYDEEPEFKENTAVLVNQDGAYSLLIPAATKTKIENHEQPQYIQGLKKFCFEKFEKPAEAPEPLITPQALALAAINQRAAFSYKKDSDFFEVVLAAIFFQVKKAAVLQDQDSAIRQLATDLQVAFTCNRDNPDYKKKKPIQEKIACLFNLYLGDVLDLTEDHYQQIQNLAKSLREYFRSQRSFSDATPTQQYLVDLIGADKFCFIGKDSAQYGDQKLIHVFIHQNGGYGTLLGRDLSAAEDLVFISTYDNQAEKDSSKVAAAWQECFSTNRRIFPGARTMFSRKSPSSSAGAEAQLIREIFVPIQGEKSKYYLFVLNQQGELSIALKRSGPAVIVQEQELPFASERKHVEKPVNPAQNQLVLDLPFSSLVALVYEIERLFRLKRDFVGIATHEQERLRGFRATIETENPLYVKLGESQNIFPVYYYKEAEKFRIFCRDKDLALREITDVNFGNFDFTPELAPDECVFHPVDSYKGLATLVGKPRQAQHPSPGVSLAAAAASASSDSDPEDQSSVLPYGQEAAPPNPDDLPPLPGSPSSSGHGAPSPEPALAAGSFHSDPAADKNDADEDGDRVTPQGAGAGSESEPESDEPPSPPAGPHPDDLSVGGSRPSSPKLPPPPQPPKPAVVRELAKGPFTQIQVSKTSTRIEALALALVLRAGGFCGSTPEQKRAARDALEKLVSEGADSFLLFQKGRTAQQRLAEKLRAKPSDEIERLCQAYVVSLSDSSVDAIAKAYDLKKPATFLVKGNVYSLVIQGDVASTEGEARRLIPVAGLSVLLIKDPVSAAASQLRTANGRVINPPPAAPAKRAAPAPSPAAVSQASSSDSETVKVAVQLDKNNYVVFDLKKLDNGHFGLFTQADRQIKEQQDFAAALVGGASLPQPWSGIEKGLVSQDGRETVCDFEELLSFLEHKHGDKTIDCATDIREKLSSSCEKFKKQEKNFIALICYQKVRLYVIKEESEVLVGFLAKNGHVNQITKENFADFLKSSAEITEPATKDGFPAADSFDQLMELAGKMCAKEPEAVIDDAEGDEDDAESNHSWAASDSEEGDDDEEGEEEKDENADGNDQYAAGSSSGPAHAAAAAIRGAVLEQPDPSPQPPPAPKKPVEVFQELTPGKYVEALQAIQAKKPDEQKALFSFTNSKKENCDAQSVVISEEAGNITPKSTITVKYADKQELTIAHEIYADGKNGVKATGGQPSEDKAKLIQQYLEVAASLLAVIKASQGDKTRFIFDLSKSEKPKHSNLSEKDLEDELEKFCKQQNLYGVKLWSGFRKNKEFKADLTVEAQRGVGQENVSGNAAAVFGSSSASGVSGASGAEPPSPSS